VTDAEFLRFLRHGGSRIATIVEIEFAYESAGALATGTIYFSDCVDAVAGSTKYHAAIEGAPDLERSIDLARLGGRGSRSSGSITINNADGAFDYLLDVIIDGRDAAISIGERGAARSDYRLLAKGAVASVSAPNDGEIVIALRDRNYLLDDTIIGEPIASGPAAGKPKPIAMGLVRNFDITPFVEDDANLIYYINDGEISSTPNLAGDVFAARDSGASLRDSALFSFTSGSMTADAGTDTLSRAAHTLAINDVVVFRNTAAGSLFAGLSEFVQYWVIAAGFTPNDFRLSLTKGGAAVNITGTVMSGTWEVDRRRYYVNATDGTLQLSASPAGRVTIDYTAIPVKPGPYSFGDSPHGIFYHVIKFYTRLATGEFAEGSGSGLSDLIAAEQSAGLKYGRVITDRVNVLDILDDISAATQSWYGWSSEGVLEVGKLDVANLSAAVAVDTIGTGDILGDLSAENLPLPFGKVTIDLDPNVIAQGDGLVDSVSAEDRALWVNKHQTRVSTTDPGTATYLANRWDYHKSAIDSRPITSSLATQDAFNSSGTDSADAQTVVDEMTELFQPWTRVHRGTVGLDKYARNPGDCITVTYPRYGLGAGVKCRVVSVRPRVSDRVVDLVLVRQATPDYTTASH
jgi:hypothetical protein